MAVKRAFEALRGPGMLAYAGRHSLCQGATAWLWAFIVGTLLLTAPPASAQEDPGPSVIISPAGGTYTAATHESNVAVTVSISFVDMNGINAGSRQAQLWSGTTFVNLSPKRERIF
jgi:hypothetical protein